MDTAGRLAWGGTAPASSHRARRAKRDYVVTTYLHVGLKSKCIDAMININCVMRAQHLVSGYPPGRVVLVLPPHFHKVPVLLIAIS